MKKLMLFFIAVSFVSCSSNDASFTQNGTKLVKVTHNFSGQTFNVMYQYSGEKIVKEILSDATRQYVYSNGHVIKIIQTSNGNITETNFEYDDQQRLIAVETPGSPYTKTYTYNDDDVVNLSYFNNGTLYKIVKIYYQNEEVVQKDIENMVDGEWVESSYSYTYDTSNQPLSLPKELTMDLGFGANVYPMQHNLLTVSVTTDSQSGSYGYAYTYNDYGYPMQATQLDSEGNPNGTVSHYFYE